MSDHESELAETELTPGSAGESANESARGRRRRNRSIAAESSVNMDELRELIQLIRENDFTEFELEREGFRVRFSRGTEPSEIGAGAFDSSAEGAGAGRWPGCQN